MKSAVKNPVVWLLPADCAEYVQNILTAQMQEYVTSLLMHWPPLKQGLHLQKSTRSTHLKNAKITKRPDN